ncbi:hypothetical protein AV530_009898 [Patagioenas fasciata monilis]|uniref:Uncharacterized protein n=1 Tax=Patagioenas fasciata monilis TaxID=372326 RepID=A0A1V4KAS1_PATFA|nr:hypothetical protein AV530_009898 [Patagioenas fasciata monilis]
MAPRGSALTSGPAQARPRRAAQAAGAAAAASGPERRRTLSLNLPPAAPAAPRSRGDFLMWPSRCVYFSLKVADANACYGICGFTGYI